MKHIEEFYECTKTGICGTEKRLGNWTSKSYKQSGDRDTFFLASPLFKKVRKGGTVTSIYGLRSGRSFEEIRCLQSFKDPLIRECFPLPPMLVFSISQEIESFSDLKQTFHFCVWTKLWQIYFLAFQIDGKNMSWREISEECTYPFT